ncbi:MAG: hypothetical protein M3395_08125 [Chloroflexota bacterium]|nr:hypothetical protein [Chloroflexota bacterium]
MDIASSLVFRHAQTLALALAVLALSGLVLILLAFAAQLLGGETAGLSPDLQLAPFRWRPIKGDLG